MYWILFIGIALISYLVQANLKNKFEKYSKMPLMRAIPINNIQYIILSIFG